MAVYQVKICEKFNINSLTDNQSKSISAIIDGNPSNDAKGADE
jgi:hypothetical protein